MTDVQKKILITGATGYIGGRLLRVLDGKGYRLRCLARRPEYLREKVGEGIEVVGGDLMDPPSLAAALSGVDTAYYLVHSMTAGGSFEEKDRRAAENFAQAAEAAGVSRIIYLGGLGRGDDLSPHLASRQEVGRILRESGVPTLEFRASVILGSGSLSFELVRALVERLPVMVTPVWVRTPAQPIAVEDVILYLAEALELPMKKSLVVEIGGSSRISYGGIMKEYARQRGLKRYFIPVPFLTPKLSSLWLSLITPLYARVGRKLLDGVKNDTTVSSSLAHDLFAVRPRGVPEAVARAIANEDEEFAATHWSDALDQRSLRGYWGGTTFGTRKVDAHRAFVAAPPEQVFPHVHCIGGETGWYSHGFLWRLRGMVDQLVGGVGLRRGRRDPACVLPGDHLDFWRVEEVKVPNLMRLYAEMKLPGRAWLQVEVDPENDGSRITFTAIFDPVGWLGQLYWYAVYPLHGMVFKGMLRGLVKTVERALGIEGSRVCKVERCDPSD